MFHPCDSRARGGGLRVATRQDDLVKELGELRDRERRERALIAAVPDMILLHARDGTFLDCKAARDFNPLLPPEEFIGKLPADVLPPDVAKMTEEGLDKAFRTGTVAVVEYQLTLGGETRFFEARIVAADDREALSLIRDVTKRKRAEETLKRRDEVLERLFRASIRINSERSLHGVLQEVVDSARGIIGCRYAALGILDAAGSGLADFVVSGLAREQVDHIGSLPKGRGVLGLVIDEKRPIRLSRVADHPSAVGFPPNHPVMENFLGVPVAGPNGLVGNLYLADKLVGDFTEEDEVVAVMFAANAAVAVQNARMDEEAVRMLEDLQSLQRSRDRFYAMINHELRNALTAVYGWSELLLRKAGEDPPRAVNETIEAADYALQLLNDLLDLNRLEAEMLELRAEHTDAPALAREAVASVQPGADASHVTLEVACRAKSIPCHTDPRRVRQILINLLSNAVRHSPRGSAVTVQIDADDAMLKFAVVDRGEGIGPEELAIIFDAYGRAKTNAGGGTGLGLTLSRRLARMLGGDLTVQSDLGRGARFTLTILRSLGERRP